MARILSSFSGTRFSFAAHAFDAFQEPEALRRNLAESSFCVTDCEYNRRYMAGVAPELAHHVGPDDRLILKLYHPQDGVEMDAIYRIVQSFALPFPFHAAPAIDMNGHTKYDAYVLELFTDKNGDVLGVAPGELFTRTPGPVPLGTTDLRLELNALRQ